MENLLNKNAVKRVKEFLISYNANLKIIALNTTAKTALNAAKSLKCETGAIIKSLLIKTDDNFLICLVAGDKRCSFKKIKKILQIKKISMASAQEVKVNTGFTIGGVSPVAHIKKINIFIDKSLKRFFNLYAAAGHSNYVFKINYNELVKITNGSEFELTE
jgi:Cys-tRNA(Pro) deacylase